MNVKAIKTGYIYHKRRRAGEVFELSDEKHFSKLWMERLVAEEPKVPAKGKAKAPQKSKAKAEDVIGEEVI